MEYWVKNCWKLIQVTEEMVIVLDPHSVQKTDEICSLFLANECSTTAVFLPPVCIRLVQPLHVAIDVPFKKKVEKSAQKHLEDNLDQHLTGKLAAGEKRVLLIGWSRLGGII